MRSDPVFDATTRPRAVRTGTMLVASALLHGLLGLMLWFDVAGIGGGFGLGVGPGFGIGSGGGVGLGAGALIGDQMQGREYRDRYYER